jgi:hypothetical protein
MNKVCDAGGICKHSPQCQHFCHFTDAVLPVYIKSAPLIQFVEDAEPVSDTWQVIGSVVVGFLLFGVAVFAALMFATGFYIWTLLI